ncbi:MAG TPA: hypothetical protein VG104_04455 [Candidatus Dormibacteraeota bacterium]|jgi:hypothetical protein|nr:hypothetical protein [Candidatus Dormibacteraeota bacterium]
MPHNQELETRLGEVAQDFDRAFPARPQLSRMIMLRVDREPQNGRRAGRRLVAELALTGLLLAGGAALAIAMAHARSLPTVNSQPAASVKPSAAPPLPASLPDEDLRAAGLTNVAGLITAENQQGLIGDQTIRLIGSYADPARIVLFFRTAPNAGIPMVRIDDAHGFLNAGSSGNGGIAGDFVTALDAGPRASADGLGHLTVTLAQWSFSLAVKIEPATSMPAPTPFPLGSWNVTVEKLEATPAVIHLQAVFAGATPDAIGMSTLNLVDASGHLLREVAGDAGVTVPKQQLNSSNYANTRVDYQWIRPVAGGTYQLRLQGPGGTRTIFITLGPI